MGRIKTSYVKNVSHELFDKHSDKFTTDFAKNKETLSQFATITSKKLENVIAGYITKLKKQKQNV
ncbi:MAG: 30S ribosomal protein S17e [Candidatus Aenigmarchaeota archaeon]|nr:30S ribosomal protein S17e [Candidatus Aenigmarchaeota archaeon]